MTKYILRDNLFEFERFILDNLNYQELVALQNYAKKLQCMYEILYYNEVSEKNERKRTLIQMKENGATYKEIGVYLWGENYRPYRNKWIKELYEEWKSDIEYIDYLKKILPKKNRTYKPTYIDDFIKETKNV